MAAREGERAMRHLNIEGRIIRYIMDPETNEPVAVVRRLSNKLIAVDVEGNANLAIIQPFLPPTATGATTNNGYRFIYRLGEMNGLEKSAPRLKARGEATEE
jgi:hypothetical protein